MNANAKETAGLKCISARNESKVALTSFTITNTDSKRVIPPRFVVTDEGVYYRPNDTEGDEGRPALFLCSKLEIVAATRNDEGGEWGRLLRWEDPEGRPHLWTLSTSMFSGDGGEIVAELLAGGLTIPASRQCRALLKSYLQTTEPPILMRSVSRIGWHGNTYVFPDSTVGAVEDGESVIVNSRGIEHHFKQAGSLSDWKEHVAGPCVGNSRLVFAVCTAFAAPLLRLIDAESGGFHIVGPSSIGKSTALRVAASVNGGKNYLRSWRSTANGLESVASLHNDALLILDESGQAQPREVGEVIYMVANGRGKIGASRTGSARDEAQWMLLFLSSGEIGVRDVINDAKMKVRGGHEVRCLDIEADAGMGSGLFERTHGDTAATFSNKLSQASHAHHGIAGRTFVSEVARSRDTTREWVLKHIKLFINDQCLQFGLTEASAEVHRALYRFALVGVPGNSQRN